MPGLPPAAVGRFVPWDARRGMLMLVPGVTKAGNEQRYIGGMHLGAASGERIKKTIERLHQAQLEMEILLPMHCTGWPAMGRLRQELPGCFRRTAWGPWWNFRGD